MTHSAHDIPGLIEDFKKRGLILLKDDSKEPLHSIIVSPAETITASRVTEVLNLTGGIPSVALSSERGDGFLFTEMARPRSTAQAERIHRSDLLHSCVSVEAREGVTTGISAEDRAHTISILGERIPNPRKLVSPGHVFPIEGRAGGVLVRSSLAEGALDIMNISGFTDAAMVVDLLDRSGDFMNERGVNELAQSKSIPCLTLSELIRHRLAHEKLVYRVAQAKIPTKLAGDLQSFVYRSTIHHGEHVALVKGTIDPEIPTLTRVQLEFTFGDVFGGNNPPTRKQIHNSLRAINAQGSGVLLYLRRPLGGQIRDQIHAWETKFKEKPASMMREFGLGAQILRDLGVKKIELLTEKKKEYVGLDTFGLEITSQRPIPDERENHA